MADSSFPSRRSSTASRRSLNRHSSRLSQHDNLIDLFSDDNAVDFMPVADGFRPPSAALPAPPTGSSSPPRPSTPQLPPRAASPPRASEYLKKRIAGQERPASIHRSSLSGPQRDSFITRVPSVSATPEASSRPLSIASGLSAPASESSYIPSAGPSHAYAAYPQVSSLNRHASTSTVQTQNRPYNGPSRPTHPYAMYPQIPGSQESEQGGPFADPADIANVGFPGLAQNYARVRGADGEDADDLIGPDGHTEQLPPYSRFPDDLPPKARRELGAVSTPLLAAATLTPSARPEEPLSEPSAESSLLGSDEGTTRINMGAARAAGEDDRSRTQRLKDKSQQRTCWGQVPVWVWIAIVIILCIIAASLGGAVGSFFVRHRADQNNPGSSSSGPAGPMPSSSSHFPKDGAGGPLNGGDITIWQTVTTTLIDAQPLTATPSGLPTLIPGQYFGVPLGPASEVCNTCTGDDTNASWQCVPQSFLSLSVIPPESPDQNLPDIQLTAEYHKDAPLFYGAQAPTMYGPAQVSWMEDVQDTGQGPAFFFQQLVDKLVILKHDDLPSSVLSNKKYEQPDRRDKGTWASWFQGRDEESEIDRSSQEDDVAAFLEERQSLPLDVAFDDLEARGGYPGEPVLTGDILWFCFWNRTILEGFIYMTKTNQHFQQNSASIATEAVSSLYSDHGWTAAATSTGSPVMRRSPDSASPTSGQQGPGTTPVFSPPPAVPYSFKIEERRGSPGMPQPYCQKMHANHSGQIVKAQDNANVVNFLNVTEKQLVPQSNVNGGSSKRHIARQQKDSSCKCIWRSWN